MSHEHEPYKYGAFLDRLVAIHFPNSGIYATSFNVNIGVCVIGRNNGLNVGQGNMPYKVSLVGNRLNYNIFTDLIWPVFGDPSDTLSNHMNLGSKVTFPNAEGKKFLKHPVTAQISWSASGFTSGEAGQFGQLNIGVGGNNIPSGVYAYTLKLVPSLQGSIDYQPENVGAFTASCSYQDTSMKHPSQASKTLNGEIDPLPGGNFQVIGFKFHHGTQDGSWPTITVPFTMKIGRKCSCSIGVPKGLNGWLT